MGYLNTQGEEIPKASGLAKVLVAAVRFYQKYLSALKMGSTCRFEPTCSAYALEAISIHGAFKGTVMAIARLCKCGPWHPGGFDFVPAKNNN
nr:membrane protein insertion efficiency factor YidD [Corynebacterium sp. UBA5992]